MNKPSIYEPVQYREGVILYLPASGTVITGRGLGPDWAFDGIGTVSHPAPGATFATQFPRTRVTSVAGTQNQELGAHLPNASDARAWRGNAASRGGFYFACRFMVNAIPATTIRFFCGLSAATSGVCKAAVSGSGPPNTVGLWCDTGDSANLTILNVDNAGAFQKMPLQSSQTLTAGVVYEFVMICNPATAGGPQGTIVTNLINVSTGALLCTQNPGTNLPASTAFMAPQIGLSNGTANLAGGDTSLDWMSVYLRPNLLLTPTGSP